MVRPAPLHVLDLDPGALEGLPLHGDQGAQPAVLGAQPAVLGVLGGEIRPQLQVNPLKPVVVRYDRCEFLPEDDALGVHQAS